MSENYSKTDLLHIAEELIENLRECEDGTRNTTRLLLRDVRVVGVRTEHPCHKVVFIFEMITEGRALDFRRLVDLCNADLVNGFVLHDLPHFICDPHLSYLSVRFDTHNRQ